MTRLLLVAALAAGIVIPSCSTPADVEVRQLPARCEGDQVECTIAALCLAPERQELPECDLTPAQRRYSIWTVVVAWLALWSSIGLLGAVTALVVSRRRSSTR